MQILLILALFLWVSLTEEVPGFFRDRSVPSKLGLGLWKKHKARDQHERFVNIVAKLSRHGKSLSKIEKQNRRPLSAGITYVTLSARCRLFL